MASGHTYRLRAWPLTWFRFQFERIYGWRNPQRADLLWENILERLQVDRELANRWRWPRDLVSIRDCLPADCASPPWNLLYIPRLDTFESWLCVRPPSTDVHISGCVWWFSGAYWAMKHKVRPKPGAYRLSGSVRTSPVSFSGTTWLWFNSVGEIDERKSVQDQTDGFGWGVDGHSMELHSGHIV